MSLPSLADTMSVHIRMLTTLSSTQAVSLSMDSQRNLLTSFYDASLSQWMASNRLNLNLDKTQFIWLGSSRQLEAVSQVQLIVGGEVVTASDTALDLGVILDAQLTMKNHVDGVARSCFHQLRQLRSIRRSVPTDALHTLVHAFISSRIDYCNAVLYGVTDAVIRRLQAVLHAAARLITGVRRITSRQHCATLFTGCPCLSALRSNRVDDIRLYPWPITSVLPRHLFTDRLRSLSFPASLC